MNSCNDSSLQNKNREIIFLFGALFYQGFKLILNYEGWMWDQIHVGDLFHQVWIRKAQDLSYWCDFLDL